MRNRKLIQVELMTTVLLFIYIISCVNATQVETMQVSPLTKKMLIVNLDEGEKFSGSLTISGGANNDIDFWITNPNGNTILNLGRVSQGTTFEFTAQESGAYTFHFDNGFSLFSTKTVILSYDVSRNLTSLLNPFLLIGTGVVIMVAIIGVVLLYRRKTQTISKTNQPTPS